MLDKLRTIMKYRKQFLSLLVGVPSYEKYVEHMQAHHPNDAIKTRREFFCEAQESRYSGKDGKVSRCC
ncbi:YbdD/YjiX family protein [Bacillota bacterium Lsc_1132]